MKLSHIFSHWVRVRKGLLEMIDNFNEEDLSFVPYDGAWSVKDILFHIATAEDGWFRYCVTKEVGEWPSDIETEDYSTAESLKTLLAEIHSRTVSNLGTTDISEFDRVVELPWGPEVPLNWIFWHLLEHEIHHRGELSLILGLLGREGLDV